MAFVFPKADEDVKRHALRWRDAALVTTALVPCLFSASAAQAGPEGGVVSHGAATIAQGGNLTTITQSTDRAVLDWQKFNLTTAETARFVQPSANSVIVNRVHDTSASSIAGTLQANGHVVITNPNGVLFTNTAKVDVGGLTVSTASVNDADAAAFVSGARHDLPLTVAGNPNAKIINQGTITAKEAGLVGLVAPNVENSGIIRANKGKVTLASGDTATLDLYGDGLVSLAVSSATEQRLVANAGMVEADGGTVLLTAASAADVANAVITVEGTLQANTVDNSKGNIILKNDRGTIQVTGDVLANGDATKDAGSITVSGQFVALGGNITANGKNGGVITATAGNTLSLADRITANGVNGNGGTVTLRSDNVTWETSTSHISVDGTVNGGTIRHTAANQIISSGQYSAKGAAGAGGKIDATAKSTKFLSAKFDARGQTNGGQVRLGGEYQGGKNLAFGVDELKNADYLVMDAGTAIDVSSTGASGNGGTAILWSEITTLALGTINATPGTSAGNGGFVEISSAGELQYKATVQTGLGSRAGTVLLDPKNIIIASASFSPTALIMGYGYTGADLNVPYLSDGLGYGYSVSLNGTQLAVGAYTADSIDRSLGDTGAVYLYSFTDTAFNGGVLQGIIGKGYTGGKNIDISNLGQDDSLGISVSLDNNRLAVGAHLDDGLINNRSNVGAVYLFSFTDSNFSGGALKSIIGYGYNTGQNIDLSAHLDGSDQFGRAVSLSGNRLAVGFAGDDGLNNARDGAGAVYLFTFADNDFNGGVLTGKIGYGYNGPGDYNLSNLDVSDAFGATISLSGTHLAVGAYQDDGATNALSNSGAVYLFDFADNQFSNIQLKKTIGAGYDTNVTLAAGDEFGRAVALSGTQLAIGAPRDDGFADDRADAGAVYLYTLDTTLTAAPVLQGIMGYGYTGGKNISPSPAIDTSDQFGYALSLDGGRLAISAINDGGMGNFAAASGTVYLYTFSDATFSGGTLAARVGSGYTGAKDINTFMEGTSLFGGAVAMDDNRLAIGMMSDSGFDSSQLMAGAVYLYSFTNNNYDGGVLEGIVGYGYTGGKNINVSQLQAGDQFGYSVSLDGTHLAVGARQDDGINNSRSNTGAIYLFSFADQAFNGGTLEATIGHGYTTGSGAKNYNLTLDTSDAIGASVSLDGNRLAFGTINDGGFGNTKATSGAVYLFSFTGEFSGLTYQGTIGNGYTGGKSYDLTLDAGDQFGIGVSLSGNRLIIGALSDDGKNNDITNAGAVYAFTFSDASFSGAQLVSTMGAGYDGVNDVNLVLDSSDNFGRAVSLEGTTLAVGASNDSGAGNVMASAGAVYLFSFANASLAGAQYDSIIGYGYTGGKNISFGGAGSSGGTNNLGSADRLGFSLSLDNGMLAVGAYQDDGKGDFATNAGAVYLIRSNAGTNVGGATFGTTSSATQGLTPDSIAALLSTPQNVILQANNDITLSDALTVNNPSGNGGTLTLQAGRNIIINALLTSDNGNVNLYANEKLSAGVVNGQRESGTANIIFGTNGAINAGTGAVHIRLDDGAGKTNNLSGNITLGAITAGTLLVESAYQYSNLILNGILTASGAGDAIILAPGGNFTNNTGSNALQLTGGGRWLVYSDHNVLNTAGGLTAQQQYNCSYGSCTIPVSGNALLYQYGQYLLQISANATRQYGDANPDAAALQALLTYSGFINGDTTSALTSQVNVALAGTATATAGAGTQHEITLSGATDDFYSIYYGPSFLTVGKRDVTATWTGGLTKTYGEANPLVGNGNFNFSGLVNGDLGTVFTAIADFGGVNALSGAGNYTVGASFNAANYNVINAPTTTLTVAKKNITATWIGGISKTYGDANPTVSSNNFNFSGLVNGDLGSAITASANFGSITQGSNAGTYTNGVTGLFNAANYNVTNTATTTLTINKRVLTPSLTGTVSKTYDGLTAAALVAGNYNLANIYNGDDVSLANFASGTFANKDAGSGKSVSVSGLTLTGTKASNYQLSSSSVSGMIGTILKKALTVTGAAVNNKVYDNTLTATLSNNGTLVGVVGSENVSLDASGITASFTNKNVANGQGVTIGGYALSGTDAGNYSISNPTGLTANITPATLTLSGVTVNNKFYDGTVAALLNAGGILNGVLGSDVVTLNASGATANFLDKNVDTGKTVTVSGYALGGTNAGNYVLTQPTGIVADIVAKTITIALSGTVSKTYDGTSNATLTGGNYVLNGAIVGDSLNLTGGLTGSYDTQNAGTSKTVSVSGLGLTGGDASNYVLASTSASGAVGTIQRANLVVSAASGLSKIYGDADPGFTYTYTGLVGGDSTASFTGNLVRAAGENAGLYTIGLGTLAATGNYQVSSFNPATFTINKRALTAVVHDAARVYGDANPLLNWSNVTWSNLANGDTGAVIDALSFNVGGANLTSAADTNYVLGIAGFTDNNYTLSSFTAGNLRINKADLLIKANDASGIAGQPFPLFTAQYIGLKNGETSSVLQGLQLKTDAAMGSVGSFNILPSGATAANYTISYAPGTLLMLPGSALVPESVQQGRINNTIQRQLDAITNSSTLGVDDSTGPNDAPGRKNTSSNNTMTDIGLDRFRELTRIVQLDQDLQRQLQ